MDEMKSNNQSLLNKSALVTNHLADLNPRSLGFAHQRSSLTTSLMCAAPAFGRKRKADPRLFITRPRMQRRTN